MLTEIYIEALLIDEGLVGQVWEACLRNKPARYRSPSELNR